MRQSGTDMVGGSKTWEKLRNRNITSMSGVQSPFIPRSSTLALIARRTCNQNIVVEPKLGRVFSLSSTVSQKNIVYLPSAKQHQLIIICDC